jgi:hypothetical protein
MIHVRAITLQPDTGDTVQPDTGVIVLPHAAGY